MEKVKVGIKEPKIIPYLFDEKLPINLAKSSEHNFLSCCGELADDSLEANATKIEISLLEHSDFEFAIRDNGDGMSIDDIKTKFFKFGSGTNSDKELGVHTGLGAKEAIMACLDTERGGVVICYAHKIGNRPVKIIWNSVDYPTYEFCDENDPHVPQPCGVVHYITKLKGANEENRDALPNFMGERYHKYIPQKININVNGQWCISQDPQYWNYIYNNSSGCKNLEDLSHNLRIEIKNYEDKRLEATVPVEALHEGKSVKGECTIRMRAFDECAEEIKDKGLLHPSDIKDGNSILISEDRCGVFLYIDDVLVHKLMGKWKPYINRGFQNQSTTVKVAFYFSSDIAKCFNFNMNKSKGISDFDSRPELQKVRTVAYKMLEYLIQGDVKDKEAKNIKKAEEYNVTKKINDNYNINFRAEVNPSSNFATISEGTIIYNLNSKMARKILSTPSKDKFANNIVATTNFYTILMEAVEDCRNMKIEADVDKSLRENLNDAQNLTLSALVKNFQERFAKMQP